MLKKIFIFSRSLLFNILFFLYTVILTIFFVPLNFIIGEKSSKIVSKIWPKGTLFLLKYICGLSYRIEGEIPDKPVIFASKHQSSMETIILLGLLNYPKFILKKELLKVPFLGIHFKLMNMIIIKREGLKETAMEMSEGSKRSIEEGRSVVLFVEGTRTRYGEPTKCKAGLALIQKDNDYADICPVAINTGKFWPKNSFLKYPGIAIIRFLPVIDKSIYYKEISKKVEEVLDKYINL
jgi:1-acyl-sn-glycerol-3-phosphate acyltransferase